MGMANRKITANLKSMAGAGAMFGKNFVTGLALGAITFGLEKISTGIRGTIADIADMADAADRVDINVGDFQGLERGFSLAGVSADEMTAGLEKFTQNIGEAAQGSGKLGDILKANGIALKTSDGSIRSTTDILRDFSDVLARTPDAAARMSLVTDAFGRGGKSMVLAMSQGRAGIDEMIKSAKEGGFVLEDSMVKKAQMLDDKFDDLTRRARVFFETLAVGVAGFIDASAQMNLEDLLPGMDPTAVLGADAVKALESDNAALERAKDQIAKLGA